METLEVGKSLVALCSEGQSESAIEQHYSENIVSVEGMAFPGIIGVARVSPGIVEVSRSSGLGWHQLSK